MGGFFNGNNHMPVPAERRVYCKVRGKDYGINLIMDILDEYGLRGIFFVETEARHYFGETKILDIIGEIRKRNHEVQLHIHPTFRFFLKRERTSDDMRKYSFEKQTEMLEDALGFLRKGGVSEILAFRPGNFNANDDTLRAARNSGLKFTSTTNLAFKNRYNISSTDPVQNDIHPLHQVIETPVTCFRQFPIRKRWGSFQICAASYREMKQALIFYHEQKLQVATFLTHSFELVRGQGPQFVKIRPSKTLIERLRRIARFLADTTSRFDVVTYQDLDELIKQEAVRLTPKLTKYYKSSLIATLQRYLLNLLSRRF